MKGFASDNYAGAHPEVLAAMVQANADHAVSYGADPWTARAEELLREHFGGHARSLLVFNGTGANVLALRACLRPWEAVVCAHTAHVQVDEGGAPEWIAGTKLLTVATLDGKLTPALVEPLLSRVGDEHVVQPRVISVTQSTELGTVYSRAELEALTAFAHERGMLVHLDGARLANAACALGLGLAATTTEVGIDVVSFGGTKNGLVLGEAVVFLRDGLADHARYLRKQSMQLASKGRFLAAGFVALLQDGLWERSAAHANAMASLLHERVAGLPSVQVTQPVQANGVFAILPPQVTRDLQERWPFYVWDDATGEVRWLCSWDTSAQDVEAFAAEVAAAVQQPVVPV